MIKLDETAAVEEIVKEVKKVERPNVLKAEVYKLKSPVVSNAIYVTISYIQKNDKNMPFEIFINSKDLSKASEYAVLTRLISAIFRSVQNPEFIIEELRGIYDPSGGYFKEGKYMHSFYAEIAEIIEQSLNGNGLVSTGKSIQSNLQVSVVNTNLKLCPKCNQMTLKRENGCDSCVNPECLYSRCDK